MRPSKDKYYQVDTLEFHCVIATLLKGFQQEFTTQDFPNLRLMCKTFASMIPKIIRWLKVDFSPLHKPRYKYEQQPASHQNGKCGHDLLWPRPRKICPMAGRRIHWSSLESRQP